MKIVTLFIFIICPLVLVCNSIYAIATSKVMAVINLIILGLVCIIIGYLLWMDLFIDKPKKDKIIKDYSPE